MSSKFSYLACKCYKYTPTYKTLDKIKCNLLDSFFIYYAMPI